MSDSRIETFTLTSEQLGNHNILRLAALHAKHDFDSRHVIWMAIAEDVRRRFFNHRDGELVEITRSIKLAAPINYTFHFKVQNHGR